MSQATCTEVKNKLTISGKLLNLPVYRLSPANIESAHCKLWHESSQAQQVNNESITRKLGFALDISFTEGAVIKQLKEFTKLYSSNNEFKNFLLTIGGYLTNRQYPNGEQRLVLCANKLDINKIEI